MPELRRKRMIPVYTRIRAKSVEEFGELVHHSGEEFIYVLEGAIKVHTEFYDPIVLGAGESIYIDSNMGHGYIAADGCDEAVVLAVCSSADESRSNRCTRCTARRKLSCRQRPRRKSAGRLRQKAASTAAETPPRFEDSRPALKS